MQIWTLISKSVSIRVCSLTGFFEDKKRQVHRVHQGTMDQLSEGRKEQQAWTNTRKPVDF